MEAVAARNVENLRWAMLQNIEDTYRRFAADLDRMLREAVAAAIAEGGRRREEMAGHLAPELERLGSLEAGLEDLRTELAGMHRAWTREYSDMLQNAATERLG